MMGPEVPRVICLLLMYYKNVPAVHKFSGSYKKIIADSSQLYRKVYLLLFIVRAKSCHNRTLNLHTNFLRYITVS